MRLRSATTFCSYPSSPPAMTSRRLISTRSARSKRKLAEWLALPVSLSHISQFRACFVLFFVFPLYHFCCLLFPFVVAISDDSLLVDQSDFVFFVLPLHHILHLSPAPSSESRLHRLSPAFTLSNSFCLSTVNFLSPMMPLFAFSANFDHFCSASPESALAPLFIVSLQQLRS